MLSLVKSLQLSFVCLFRQRLIDENAFARTNVMSAEEVIIRIKDKMSQLTPEIRKAFLACDKKGKGRITKRQFREVG